MRKAIWPASLLLAALVPLTGLQAQSNYATPYSFTTLAGMVVSLGSTDGTGSEARFYQPRGVALDGAGNVYVADTNNHTIRKITPAGVVTTFAGTVGAVYGPGGVPLFGVPTAVAVDGSGNVYVTDSYFQVVWKITAGGVMRTLAGSPGLGGTADGTGSAARFYLPGGVVVDGSGNLFVSDSGNRRIRMITPGGVVTTFAGGSFGSANGTGTAAQFGSPGAMAIDGSGNLWVADAGNHTIRKITPLAEVTTFAGSSGNPGSTDGTGSAARFNGPGDVAVDGAGNLFVADTGNNTIRKITSAGVVTTLAGTAGAYTSAEGLGSAARFHEPNGVAVDGAGNVFVADTMNHTIRMITPAAVVTTFAGSAPGGSADGLGTAARFNGANGPAVDGAGNIFVADTFNDTIRKITPAGLVTTIAGSPGLRGSTDGTGSSALFREPQGVAVDGTGDLYVADSGNHTIRKITPAGDVTTLAGLALNLGSDDGTGSAARFKNPTAVAADSSGNVYVADTGNNTIRMVTPGGVVTTFAGIAGPGGGTDGTGTAARFSTPQGVVLDGSGNLYVTDFNGDTVRKITPDAVVTTLAGLSGAAGSKDGTGSAARFNGPVGVAVDGAGNVYVVDSENSTIRKITPALLVTTLAGKPGSYGNSDGIGSAARISAYGVVVDGAGTLYVTTNGISKGMPGAVNDSNGDGHPDILWQHSVTGDRGFWLMNGTAYASWVDMGYVSTDWRIAATADFNADGKADILWENTSTGDRGFWLMNGTAFASWVDMGYVTTDWRIAAAADFNGDGQPDILWENTVTGVHGFWLMNGTAYASWVNLGAVSTDWRFVAAADFNGAGKADILMENTVTGDRGFWLMNGTAYASWVDMGYVSTDWHIAAVADFNADGQPDILWENTVTGDRGFWLMNGTTFASWVDLGYVPTDWRIAP